MKDMFEYSGKKLKTDFAERNFAYNIRTVLEDGDKAYVLLKIPFNDSRVDNLLCVNEHLAIVWDVQSLDEVYPNMNILPYEQVQLKDGVLYATDFYGRCYLINALDGTIKGKKIVK